MRLTSEKFKYLDLVQNYLPIGTVPDFKRLKSLERLENFHGSYILRSSLKDESNKRDLMSGKSLSLGGIDSLEMLKDSWEKIQAQHDLDEVILQREIFWESHITLYVEADFFFGELKSKNGGKTFLYETTLGKTLSVETKLISELIRSLKALLSQEKYWLCELGVCDGKLFLFQLHPIGETLLKKVFSNDLILQMVSSRLRFSSGKGLFDLLKMEWKAWRFRQNVQSMDFETSQIFLNWEFLFHYFRLFCMIKNLRPNGESFSQFLSTSFSTGFLSPLIQKHLEIASIGRNQESYEVMNIGFQGSGLMFIGKGQLNGIVGEDIFVCDEIPLSVIYGDKKPRVILTKEVGVLSHPVLASVENGIPLVLGLTVLPSRGERIFLDFEYKNFRIE
jgi:hypothetical protein